jgi:hypothetical protein
MNSGQRKRSRAPVRSRHVPLSRPQPPQTAAKLRGFSPTVPGFTAETDSPVEGDGFEPSVPREEEPFVETVLSDFSATPLPRGTEGSDLAPSAGESAMPEKSTA